MHQFISKKLLLPFKQKSGRNNTGKITVQYKRGNKYINNLIYPNIDFWYATWKKNFNIAIVLSFFMHKHLKVSLALILFLNGIFKGLKRFIINTQGLNIGDLITYNNTFQKKIGSVYPIGCLNIGSYIHSLELFPKTGSKFIRTNGSYGTIISSNSLYVCIKLPSGKYRLFLNKCLCFLGKIFFINKNKIKKASQLFFSGHGPIVRGKAKNAVDHPHGGGTGNTCLGLKNSKNFIGKFSRGIKTRKKYKIYSKFLLK